MQKTHIKNTHIKDVLIGISNFFEGKFTEKDGLYTCTINNLKGAIVLTGIDFDSGLSFLNFKGNFKEITELLLKNNNENIIEFIGVSAGNIIFSEGKVSTYLNESRNQSMVISNKYPSIKSYTFAKDVATEVSIISLDVSMFTTFRNNEYNLSLLKLICWLNSLQLSDKQLYIGNQHEEMSSLIHTFLEADREDNTTVLTHFESLIRNALVNQIALFHPNASKLENNTSLKDDELTKIVSLIATIEENPQELYTISMLCEMTRLSPAKLQEGFKILCDRTVIDFIRYVRLTAAEKLIRTTDMSIAEIIYSVGFTSRSYFSKIFKNKYGDSPKQYQLKARVAR
ncbi:helix-turn-helix transcriptional regulator [Kordia algicida OT-1]|uniref:Hypothetical transcriptional regulator, AraC family protein n=1 Tax=Kordia algicida OT-1 TaxID=391587 RepID=A9E8I3_9FLAO|nr:helix-turn-helix transcriptional regulator [Kordia algicida]EDP94776.1 hypothetical transcriptional regulator, AraC family protein [Kordia algicida OT-1]